MLQKPREKRGDQRVRDAGIRMEHSTSQWAAEGAAKGYGRDKREEQVQFRIRPSMQRRKARVRCTEYAHVLDKGTGKHPEDAAREAGWHRGSEIIIRPWQKGSFCQGVFLEISRRGTTRRETRQYERSSL